MHKIDKLERAVRDLYNSKNPNRDEWADWLYKNHVLIVANFAEELAHRYYAPVDQCRAAAILHDIADTKMSRFEPTHEEASLDIARDLLDDAGYSENEVSIIVDDALRFHSCRDGKKPTSLIGKILSTADALGHLNTNFYTYATEELMAGRDIDWRKNWVRKKLPRDFNEKIAFSEIREETRPNFEKLSAQFAN